MNPDDYIFKQVYKGAMEQGAHEVAAKDCAILAMNEFKKGRFKKAKELIDGHIKMAKKL